MSLPKQNRGQKSRKTKICAYEKEIVARLEPAKIRERFPGGYDDFVHYLNFVSDSYRDRLTAHVDQKTRDCVKEYLNGLEQVFDQATGYFRKRESMLAFEDKFYGSLAKSRQHIMVNMEKSLQKTKDYCGKPAEPETLTCICGQQIDKGVSFCQNCGRKVSELLAAPERPQLTAAEPQTASAAGEIQEKECICGARIPAGQTMCMECGRVIL